MRRTLIRSLSLHPGVSRSGPKWCELCWLRGLQVMSPRNLDTVEQNEDGQRSDRPEGASGSDSAGLQQVRPDPPVQSCGCRPGVWRQTQTKVLSQGRRRLLSATGNLGRDESKMASVHSYPETHQPRVRRLSLRELRYTNENGYRMECGMRKMSRSRK